MSTSTTWRRPGYQPENDSSRIEFPHDLRRIRDSRNAIGPILAVRVPTLVPAIRRALRPLTFNGIVKTALAAARPGVASVGTRRIHCRFNGAIDTTNR